MLTRQFFSEVNLHRVFRAYFTRPLAANSPPPSSRSLAQAQTTTARPRRCRPRTSAPSPHRCTEGGGMVGEVGLCLYRSAQNWPEVCELHRFSLFSFRFDLVWNGDRPVREGKEPDPFFPSGWGDLFSMLQGRARALRFVVFSPPSMFHFVPKGTPKVMCSGAPGVGRSPGTHAGALSLPPPNPFILVLWSFCFPTDQLKMQRSFGKMPWGNHPRTGLAPLSHVDLWFEVFKSWAPAHFRGFSTG